MSTRSDQHNRARCQEVHEEIEESEGGTGVRHAQPQNEEGDRGDDKPVQLHKAGSIFKGGGGMGQKG